MANSDKPKFGIVVGGGPAPGLNGVISAATIEAINNGYEVVGIMDGFKWLAQGDTSHVVNLTIEDVSRVHIRGGSILRTARTNPTKSEEMMNNVISSLQALNIGHLITIGGDDTAYTSSQVNDKAAGQVATAHVPKTIDNDLPLPPSIPTFGYETARQEGHHIIKNMSEDARTTGRWYFVVAMGRTAGHLALGIGKSAGATVTIIPEEFGSRDVSIREVCDILEGSIIKRIANGNDFGVAVIAEGVASRLTEDALKEIGEVELDEHGHVRLSEVDLGEVCKNVVRKSLAERGIDMTIVSKDLGYELRCADPNPFDAEYTRDLGYGAVKFLLQGGTAAMITIQGGVLKPIRFHEIQDPETHRTRVRLVDVHGESYEVARKYMIRLEPEDFEDEVTYGPLAEAAKMSVEDFSKRFSYLKGTPQA
ncbi:MAG: diphosphate--fructose-6-phosphate 1-phosphotransferase [Kiritimatiellae bacterium]|nr:diphosphate--fructose-6-phosphate 1-phosphotransferase [Kiritimatiellia bacterium]